MQNTEILQIIILLTKKNKICIGFRFINAIAVGGVDNFGEIKISEIKAVKDKIDLSGSKRIY